MFYTFIVLFEKSSTLIDLMDLCKDFIVKKRRKVTHLALMGWGCYSISIFQGDLTVKKKISLNLTSLI
jgi:hypothetical protein